jgi:hypothetical protein
MLDEAQTELEQLLGEFAGECNFSARAAASNSMTHFRDRSSILDYLSVELRRWSPRHCSCLRFRPPKLRK